MAIRGFFLALLWAANSWASPFCVQTFNAYGPAYAKDVGGRTQRLAEIISSENPACDLIQFQELWTDGQLKILERGLQGRQVLPARILAPKKEKVGLVSVSPGAWGLSQPSSLHLYEVNNEGGILDRIRRTFKVEKGFHQNNFSTPEGFSIQTLNTHTHPTDQAVRLAQVLELVEWGWENFDFHRPLLVTGDFNATPDSLEIRLLTKLLGLTDSYGEMNGGYRDNECTICRRNPIGWTFDDRVVDYVFYRPGADLALRPVRSEMNWDLADPLSDHKGIRTWFEWDLITRRQPVKPSSEEALALLNEAERRLLQDNDDFLASTFQRIERMREIFRR